MCLYLKCACRTVLFEALRVLIFKFAKSQASSGLRNLYVASSLNASQHIQFVAKTALWSDVLPQRQTASEDPLWCLSFKAAEVIVTQVSLWPLSCLFGPTAHLKVTVAFVVRPCFCASRSFLSPMWESLRGPGILCEKPHNTDTEQNSNDSPL